MVSAAAQNGFGAATKLNNLLMTPLNGLGAAMTSFTAQNLGAGDSRRIRRGALQALGMAGAMALAAIGLGLLCSRNGAYLHLFLSADKVTEATVAFGNRYLYVDPPCTSSWPSSSPSATACRASASPSSSWGPARRSWRPGCWCASSSPPPWRGRGQRERPGPLLPGPLRRGPRGLDRRRHRSPLPLPAEHPAGGLPVLLPDGGIKTRPRSQRPRGRFLLPGRAMQSGCRKPSGQAGAGLVYWNLMESRPLTENRRAGLP